MHHDHLVKWLSSTLFSLIGVIANALNASATPYPTTEQLQNIRDHFGNRIPAILRSSSYGSVQNQSAIQQAQAFATEWATVNPAIAPFLGHWHGAGFSVSIYPSFTPNQVCVLTYEDEIRFAVRKVHEELLNVAPLNAETIPSGQNPLATLISFRSFSFIRQGEFLVWAYLEESGSLTSLPMFSPYPLTSPNEVLPQNQSTLNIIRRFNAAGCTTGLPNSPHTPIALPQLLTNITLSSSQTQDNVTVQLNGGYMRSNSFDVYLTIYSNSNRNFGLVSGGIKIYRTNGNEVGAQFDSDNDDNIVGIQGSLTGRVTINLPWNVVRSQNLILVVKEATTGGREFRLPIE